MHACSIQHGISQLSITNIDLLKLTKVISSVSKNNGDEKQCHIKHIITVINNNDYLIFNNIIK